MHKYLRHLGDYAKDTKHLSMLEHGAYNQMLDWCYAAEKPLPTDEKALFRLCSAFDKAEQQAVRSIRDEFFVLTDDGYTQKRVLEEIADYKDKAAKAARAADKRWQGERNADAMQTHSDGNADGMPRARVPITHNHKPTTNFLSAPDGAGPNGDGAAPASAAELEPGSGQKKKKAGAVLEGIQPLAWSPETGWQGFSQDLWDEFALAYPACDIRRQMLAMEQWLKANPAKARKNNWRKFVTNWLAKEQDRGGDLRGLPQPAWSGLGAKNDGGSSKPLLTIEDAPAGHEQAMEALFGEQWREMCPAWPQMTASDKSQVRAWLRQHGKEAA